MLLAWFAIDEKWHECCASTKKWARNVYERPGGHKDKQNDGTGTVALFGVFIYWQNLKVHGSTLELWCQTNEERGSCHQKKCTGILSRLVVRDILVVLETSWWFWNHIVQNMKSFFQLLKAVAKNMRSGSSETWACLNILKYWRDSWTNFWFFPKKQSISEQKFSFILFTFR